MGKVFVALHPLSIEVINFWHTKTFGALGKNGNCKAKLHPTTKQKTLVIRIKSGSSTDLTSGYKANNKIDARTTWAKRDSCSGI